MKPVILIQTDFSLSWSAVAQMKGVMKQVDPELEIVDLCHDIKTFDPWEASLSLQATEPYWPKGTIFVSVVDLGVGTARRACAARLKDGMIIITPDNGSLTHLLHSVGVEQVREIDESINRYPAKEQVSVFHGRDLFGYCAARLATGVISFEEVGPEYPVEEIVKLDIPEPVVSEGEITGTIETLDVRFGSLWTNISSDLFQKIHAHYGDLIDLSIYNGSRKVHRSFMTYAETFASVEVGESLIYVNSMNHMAVAINQGSFANAYHIGTRGDWRITMKLAGSRSRTKEASDSTI